jgi:predicted RNA-binding protein Jag
MMDFANGSAEDVLAMETSDGRRRFFAGDSLQQALVQAANYFNLDPEYVAYRSLEKRHGFLKVRRKVVIEVDPDNPRREKPQAIPAAERSTPPVVSGRGAPANGGGQGARSAGQPPRGPKPERRDEGRPRGGRGPRSEGRGGRRSDAPRRRDGGERNIYRMADRQPPVREGLGLVRLAESPRSLAERYPQAEGAVAEAAKKGAELLLRIAGLDLQATIYKGEERLEVELAGPDVDWCFADDGEFVMAAEHLLPRLIRTLSGETAAVRVDCDNFHEIREERLRALAQKVAEEVRRHGKPRMLEPMNPADRRVVHTTLADDPGVGTESIGDGYFKRVTIRPL